MRVPSGHIPASEIPSSRSDEAAAGWYGAEPPPPGDWVERLGERRQPKWDTFSWVTVRALLDSANDVIATHAPSIIRDRRRRWIAAQRAAGAELPEHGPPRPGRGSFGPDFVIDWTALERPRFLLVGDPGEADASQYATIAPLLEIHRGGPSWDPERRRASDFMVVLSDVIYPAGDVNDYVNGFYLPFADYDRPIYALPGNHDWYDGLDGFMYHFCRSEPLPRVRFSARGRSAGDRVLRALWRRASRPDRDLLAPYLEARAPGVPPRPVQPAPYFAIELAELLIVAIDTGVAGELDAEQGAWLERVSARPKPKLLLTGKPIWFDNRYRPGAIDGRRTTVDEIVARPEHGYVAVIGGDTHNYQRYSVHDGARTIEYLVAGGGGAYLSATHTIPTVGRDGPRVRFGEDDFRCYPLRGDSLALFCRRMGPVMVKALAAALLVLAAAAAVFVLAPLSGARALAAALAAVAIPAALALPVLVARLAGGGGAERSGAAGADSAGGGARPGGARAGLVTAALAAAALVAALLAIGDARATVAVAVALATPLAALLGLVVAYAARGSLPASAPDWLLVAPLLALPPALWAPYGLGPGLDALAYAAAPVAAAALFVPAAARLRASADHTLHTAQRALVALLWLALAAVVGEGWTERALAVVLALIALLALAVPHLGPGRHRTHPQRGYRLGTPTAAIVALALATLGLAALPATAAAVAGAGAAAVVGVLAAAGALYLLIAHRLADPRVLRHLRTGAITPAGAAHFVAAALGAGRPPTRPGTPAPEDAARGRMARVIHGIGGAVGSLADTNEPPFFKSFLSAEVAGGRLELRCWGVTGYEDPRRSPSLEDSVSIALPANIVHSQGTPPEAMSADVAAVPDPAVPPTSRERRDVTFRSGAEDCSAWFYPGASGASPCVILAHGLDGVKEQALDRYAEAFARRGLAAFVFDYRHFGASGGQPRQLMSNRRQLEDWRAAIAHVRTLPGVNPERIALWGISNAGGHVLKAAAADPLIRAVVVQAPLISGFAQVRSYPVTHSARVLWRGALDQASALLGLRPVGVKAVGRPNTLAVTTSPDALSGLARITPAGSTWENRLLARFALTTAFYSATRAGRRLTCPLLVCVADGDDVIPLGPALALARRKGTLRRYDATHFGQYHGPVIARAARDQADFLHAQLADGLRAVPR